MQITSTLLDRIRCETRWGNVREERRTVRWLFQKHHDRKIDLVPSDPRWPEIYFVLSDDYRELMQFGFGEWHGHPEIDEAVALAADFVAGRTCVHEQRTTAGKYQGSYLAAAGDAPRERSPGGVLHRLFFNRAPEKLPD